MALHPYSWGLPTVNKHWFRDYEAHARLRAEKYDTNDERDEIYQY